MSALEQWIPGSVGVVICLVPTFFALRLIFWAMQSKTWPSAEGKVTFSQTRKVRQGRSSPGMAADIGYEFEVDGRKYQGQRVRFGAETVTNIGVARDTAAAYPHGKKVDVYYNPANPRHSTLERRAVFTLYLGSLLGLGIAASIIVSLLSGSA